MFEVLIIILQRQSADLTTQPAERRLSSRQNCPEEKATEFVKRILLLLQLCPKSAFYIHHQFAEALKHSKHLLAYYNATVQVFKKTFEVLIYSTVTKRPSSAVVDDLRGKCFVRYFDPWMSKVDRDDYFLSASDRFYLLKKPTIPWRGDSPASKKKNLVIAGSN